MALSVITTGISVLEATAKAKDQVMEGLQKVKVAKSDAMEGQREVEGTHVKYWKEKCEIMKSTAVPVASIDAFLDYMHDCYEGIDAELRKKLDGIKFDDDSWSYKIVEVDLKPDEKSTIRYGMIGFGKSPDQKHVACMYVMFGSHFEFAPHVRIESKERSILWGLWKKTTSKRVETQVTLSEGTIRRLKNFFRFKALEGFMKEGVIDKINFVHSLDAIDDENAM